MMGKNQTKENEPESSQSLTLSIGTSSAAVIPGFPSPSSTFLPPPTIAPTEFAAIKDKRRERQNSKATKSTLDTSIVVTEAAIISPTTPTPDSLHRQRSFEAPIIDLPKDLPTDEDVKPLNSFAAAAASLPPSSVFNPKTTIPSNPPTPSSPSFQFSPQSSSFRKNPNRDSTMSTFSASSAASVDSASSLKSTRPAPPSPAMSRRTSGTGITAATSPVTKRFSAGPGAGPGALLERSNSSSRHNSPKVPSMSSNSYRFSSPALRRDSSSMSIPAPLPLPLTPVPGSAGLSSDTSSLPSAASIASSSLSSAGLKTATTASVMTGLSKGKITGTQLRRPIKIRDFAYAPPEGYWLAEDFDPDLDSDPRFLGLGSDGKSLHVPTPNRVKVLNKALLTSTSSSTPAIIANANHATYAAWKIDYKERRKDQKAALKRRAKQLKEAKRERERARNSINSVRSVGSTRSTTSTSSVSSTSSRSEVSDGAEGGDDDDEDDGMGGWAGFKFGLGRLSQSWGFGQHIAGSNGVANSNRNSNTAAKTPSKTSSSIFPTQSDLERNFGFESESESNDTSSAAVAPSSDSSSHSSHSTDTDTDTEGEGDDDEYHDAPESHPHFQHHRLDLDLGLDSPSPLDYDRQYSYDDYGAIPNSAYPSASPYPSNDGYGYYGADNNDSSFNGGEDLLPGLYRALYTFDPEGPSEMRLIEGEIVKVIGRGGGGGGWAVVLDKYASTSDECAGENGHNNGSTTPNATNINAVKYALVPESYLELVQLDGPEITGPPSVGERGGEDQSAEMSAQKTPTLGL